MSGQIALVTGATRGIGKAIADQLAAQGIQVAGTATTAEGAAKISERDGVTGFVYNSNEEGATEKLLKEVEEQLGAPEILVNNAAITRDNLMLRMKDDEWDSVINTNLSSVYRLIKACVKPMVKARKGRIINISSVVGSMGNAGQANYAAAKAGLIGFTKSLAQEFASRGITANVIAPGFIATDMTEVLPDKIKEDLLNKIPMKRLGEPEEVAKVAVFLASDLADYVTGQTIHVNGGMYMA